MKTRKLTRKSLNELEILMPKLSEIQQKHLSEEEMGLTLVHIHGTNILVYYPMAHGLEGM